MDIDYRKLIAAVSSRTKGLGFPVDTAHLNRHTGEIVFLGDMKADAGDWLGTDDIESNPNTWIAIPKYEGRHANTIELSEPEERFALDWLASCGLGAYTIKY